MDIIHAEVKMNRMTIIILIQLTINLKNALEVV